MYLDKKLRRPRNVNFNVKADALSAWDFSNLASLSSRRAAVDVSQLIFNAENGILTDTDVGMSTSRIIIDTSSKQCFQIEAELSVAMTGRTASYKTCFERSDRAGKSIIL